MAWSRPILLWANEEASPDFSGKASLLVEAAGQLFQLFRAGLDYAFIPHRCRCWMRGVLSGSCHHDPDPGAGSDAHASQPVHESLHGKASWPRLTARRCHVTFVTEGSPNEPRYHFALTSEGNHCVPSHQSNPRPQALDMRIYVRSCFFIFSPSATRRAGKTSDQRR